MKIIINTGNKKQEYVAFQPAENEPNFGEFVLEKDKLVTTINEYLEKNPTHNVSVVWSPGTQEYPVRMISEPSDDDFSQAEIDGVVLSTMFGLINLGQ